MGQRGQSNSNAISQRQGAKDVARDLTESEARSRLNANIPGWMAFVNDNRKQEQSGFYVGRLMHRSSDATFTEYGDTRAEVCGKLEAAYFQWLAEKRDAEK